MINTEKIAIIIPFYQKEEGILLRAVKSVFEQKGLLNFKIFVVDDGSPVKARNELASILIDHPENIVIFEQKNAGPAKARNTAIKAAKTHTYDYIAFLDSDDEWSPHHLDTALKALGTDKDFYFSDVVLLGGKNTVFASKDFPDRDKNNCLSLKDSGNFEYKGDLLTLILSGHCPIATPAVVYRASSINFLFREDLTVAGEDYFFWLHVASSSRRIVFSTYRGVKLNYGVNLYQSVEWGTNENLKKILHNWRYNHLLTKYIILSSEQKKLRKDILRRSKENFAENIVHMLLHRKYINLGIFKEYCFYNPEVIFLIPYKIMTSIFANLCKIF